MADILLKVEENVIPNIAQSIMNKTGKEEPIALTSFASEIDGISTTTEVVEAIEMSQAEYNALSEEEQNNGLYFIKDGGMTDATMKKDLWNGEWSSGTIEVPNTDKYMLFRINMSGQGTSILAIRNASYIRGIGGYTTATPSVLIYNFAATVSGNNWTFVACNHEHHTPDGSHGTITNDVVTSIVGII